MDFKEKIIAHQNGEYNFAKELIDLALSDDVVDTKLSFSIVTYGDNLDKYRWRPKRTVKQEIPEHFIAIKIKTILEKHSKKAYTLRRGFEDDDEQIDVLYFQLLKMDMHYTIDELDKITPEQIKMIEDDLGYWDSFDWVGIYEKYVKILPEINAEKQRYYDEIVPLAKESLNEIIPLIDVEMSPEQIVKFVNISVIRKTYHKLSKHLGSRTFRIGKEKYYVSEFYLEGINVKRFLKINEETMSKTQLEFARQLIEHVQNEVDANNTKLFTFNSDGYVTKFNKRYFADKMNLEESNFKKRLKRIQSK